MPTTVPMRPGDWRAVPGRAQDGVVPGQAGEPGQRCEAVVGAGPVRADGAGARAARDRAQDSGNDDGVVGVAEHGHEVGHEVDREREVAEQEPEPHAGGVGHGGVGG